MQSPKNEFWMPCPQVNVQIPGLAYISPLDQLIVADKLDALHNIIGLNRGIGYTIFNNKGQKVFIALQEKKYRKFIIRIFNVYGNEIIQVKRPFKFCLSRIRVHSPPGNFIGAVNQHKCKNNFLIKDAHNITILRIVKQDNLTYNIMSDSKVIGVISKGNCQVMGFGQFGVSFPMNMDIDQKVVLLGACFLIGYLKYRSGCYEIPSK